MKKQKKIMIICNNVNIKREDFEKKYYIYDFNLESSSRLMKDYIYELSEFKNEELENIIIVFNLPTEKKIYNQLDIMIKEKCSFVNLNGSIDLLCYKYNKEFDDIYINEKNISSNNIMNLKNKKVTIFQDYYNSYNDLKLKYKINYFYDILPDYLEKELSVDENILIYNNDLKSKTNIILNEPKLEKVKFYELVFKNNNGNIKFIFELDSEEKKIVFSIKNLKEKLPKGKYTLMIKLYTGVQCYTYWYDKDLEVNSNGIYFVEVSKTSECIIEKSRYMSIYLYSYTTSIKGYFLLDNNEKITFGNYPNRYTKIMNIDARKIKKFVCDSRMYYTIIYSDNMINNTEQIKYNKKYNIKRDNLYKCNYSFYDPIRARGLIVTFPGFNTTSNISYPVVGLNSYKEKLDDFAILALQDYSLPNGSYLTYDFEGNDIKNNIIKLIKNYIKYLNLKEEDLILYGNSKGGTCALKYGHFFPKACIISDAPQIDVRKKKFNPIVKFHNDEKIYIENYVGDIIKLKNEKSYIGYSNSDIDSSCNIKKNELGVNQRIYNNCTHSKVIQYLLPLSIDIMKNKGFNFNEIPIKISKKELYFKVKNDHVYIKENNNLTYVEDIDIINYNDIIVVVSEDEIINYRIYSYKEKIYLKLKKVLNI